MKALQIKTPGEVEIIEVSMPVINSDGEVLVRIKASSICSQHEYKIFNNLYTGENKCSYPASPGFPGHEASGEVIEVGRNVKNLSVGDRVVMSGHCGNLHQEYVVCPEKWALKTISAADWTDISATELFACMLALLTHTEYIAGGHCVVIGLGPAGLAAVEWLRLLGAEKITGIDKFEERLKRGIEVGLDSAALVANKEAIEKLVGEKPEAVIECSGTHEGFRLAFRMASKEALLFGYNDQPFEVNEAEWFAKSLVIRTRFAFDIGIWQRTVSALNRGLIEPGKIISHRLLFNASSYKEAMSLMGKPDVYKIVMEHK